MGRAYDYAFRPTLGDPAGADGGPCDDRAHPVELYAASADRSQADAAWQSFLVCPEHEAQLRRYDEQLRHQGAASRFRLSVPDRNPAGRAG